MKPHGTFLSGDLSGTLFVEFGVEGVEIPAVQLLLHEAQAFAEPLVVHDLPFPEEADRVADFRVFDEAQDVVVGCSCLLLCGQVFVQVCDGVALGLEDRGGPGHAAGGLGPERQCVVYVIGGEAGTLDLFGRQVLRQLVDDGADHLHVGQFFRAYRSNGNVPYPEKR